MITLTDVEHALANHVGRMRYEANRTASVTDQQIGGQDKYFIDRNGFGGELAFAKYVNLYPDLLVKPTRGTPDYVMNGITIDVKTTHYPNGRLLVKQNQVEVWDVYVLVVGTLPNFRIAGWHWGREICQEGNLINLGHGEGYGLTQDKLLTAESIDLRL